MRSEDGDVGVDRLGEPRVDDGRRQPARGEKVGSLRRDRHHPADGDDGHIMTAAQHRHLADLERFERRGARTRCGTARVPHGERATVCESRREEAAQLVGCARRRHHHARHHPQVREIERAVMRRAVGTGDP